MLEIIEKIYNQLIEIILGENKSRNYIFCYNKDTPLEKSKKIDNLMKLESQGYSVAYVLDEMGINSEDFFDQSIYEIEKLKLREKVIPPQNTNTTSSSGGRPNLVDPTNGNTVKSKGTDGNNIP